MTLLQEIEQKNIDANMEMAMETTPESFGSVIMLYINCKYDTVLIAVDLLFTRLHFLARLYSKLVTTDNLSIFTTLFYFKIILLRYY
jgi:hypothetical protein